MLFATIKLPPIVENMILPLIIVEPDNVDVISVLPNNVDTLLFDALIVQLVRVELFDVFTCSVENRIEPLCITGLITSFDVKVLP